MSSDVNSYQVGGKHYKGGSYQHWDFVAENSGCGYFIGVATKYICRYKDKGNPKQDLEKAKHYVLKLIDLIKRGKIPSNPDGRNREAIYALYEAYKLEPLEFAICFMIANFERVDELVAAVNGIDELLKKYL